MKLTVKVKIGRRENIFWDGEALLVGVDAPPVDGKSNKRLIEILSELFDVPKSLIEIVQGHTARLKVIQIDIDEERFNKTIASVAKAPDQLKLI